MRFLPYSANTTAVLQLSAIKASLIATNYRVQRVKGKTVWEICPEDQRLSQRLCFLTYDGWGRGIGKWWRLYGEVPVTVIQILKACVKFEADAGGEA